MDTFVLVVIAFMVLLPNFTTSATEFNPGTSREGHIIYSSVGFVSIIITSAMFATRLKSLNLTSCSGVNSIRILSVSMYFCTIAYIVSTGILISSWDFRNEFLCKTAVYLCLTFFIIDKIILYLFLVERSHQLRSHLARRKDWMYILGVAIVIIGFGTIAAGFVFADNVTGMSKIDGKCRIRLPLKVTLPFLFYDVCINVLLAVVFFSLCSVHIRKQPWRKICNFSLSALSWRPTLVIHRTEDVLVFFMVKSLLGAAAVIIPTIGSLAILFYLNGHEQAWICLTMCTVYMTWGTIVIHWLTSDARTELVSKPAAVRIVRGISHNRGVNGEYIEMN